MSANLQEPAPAAEEHHPSHTLGQTLWAMFWHRCPRCHKGHMFRGLFAMNDPCPVCGLLYQREEGDFLGAMYISYVLGAALLFPFFFLLPWLLPDWNCWLLAVLSWVLYLPLVPAIFRWSRVVWVYIDRAGCPGTTSAGPYE